MIHIDMDSEWLADSSHNYECRKCPQCKAMNWIVTSNQLNIGSIDTEAIKCWKCLTEFWLNSRPPKHLTDDDLHIAPTCLGAVDPAIPHEYLELLVDASEEKFYELQYGVRDRDDTDLIDQINRLRDAVNYVKTLLREGKVPHYEPPEYLQL